MLDVALYAGQFYTGRTYQALRGALLASATAKPPTSLVVFTDTLLDKILYDITCEINVDVTDLKVYLPREHLSEMDATQMQDLLRRLPDEMVLVVDQFGGLADNQVHQFVQLAMPRLHAVHWVVGAQALEFNPKDPRWPAVFNSTAYRVTRHVCSRAPGDGRFVVKDVTADAQAARPYNPEPILRHRSAFQSI